MVYQIGITGGIGSGKTTICKIFETLGIKVYYADTRAKYLMHSDPELIAHIHSLFGEQAYLKDGSLNRKYIASEVFADQAKLNQLNAKVHPATRKDYRKWYERLPATYSEAFVLKEAAILFEAGSAAQSDAIITVYAPKALRLRRVIARDGSDAKAVLARMDKQWPDSKKIKQGDFILFNDGMHPVIPQVLAAKRYFSNSEASLSEVLTEPG